MKVCMLVRNPYVIDSRVRKEAHAVAEAGHDVTIVAIKDKDNQLPDEQWEGPVRVLRVRVKNLLGEWRSRRREADRRADLWIRKALGQPRRLAGNAWRRLGGSSPLSWAAAALLMLGCLLALLAFWWMPLGLLAARGVIFLEKALLDSRLLVALRKTEACRILSHFLSLRPTVYGLRADVYHAHNLDTLRLAVMAARRSGGATVYDSHELEYGRYAPTWTVFDRWFMRREERLLVPKIDAMISVNKPIADWLSARYRREVVVVNNSSALKAGSAGIEEVGDWRERLELGNRTLIMYVGSLIPGRGLPVMLDVMEILDPREYVFVLFGPEGIVEADQTYRQMVAARGLEDRIILVGSIPENHLLATLSQADCSIALTENRGLSHRLALPNKLFQSALAHAPLVTSNMPGLADLTRRYRLGVSVDGTDPAAIIDGIRRVCAHPDRFAKDEQLLENLATEHGWSTNRQRLLEVYVKIEQRGVRSSRRAGVGSGV